MPAGHCAKCGTFRRHLHKDHIQPKWNGGADNERNWQYLCANCHEDKTWNEMRSAAYRAHASKAIKQSMRRTKRRKTALGWLAWKIFRI